MLRTGDCPQAGASTPVQLIHLTLHPAGQSCFLQQSRKVHKAKNAPQTNEECKSDLKFLFSSLNKNMVCLCQLRKLYFPPPRRCSEPM